MQWLKLTIPAFDKWYKRWYYRLFHPSVHKWLRECEVIVQEEADKAMANITTEDVTRFMTTGYMEVLIKKPE